MTTFAVTDPNHTVAALNYLLSNQGQGTGGNANVGNALIVNTSTGAITVGNSTSVQSYYYRYINIRYADTSSGGGFSTTPTNKLYYGVLNSNAVTPANIDNPASYQWFKVSGGGFGTTKFLFYTTLGGRQIQFSATTTKPNVFYEQATTTAIDLDFVLSTQALPTIVLTTYQRSNTAPAVPTGGTYNFSNLTFTPPTGWSNSVPTGNAPFYSSQNTFIAPTTGVIAAPSLSWTTPVITGQDGANGSNGASVFTYSVYQQNPGTPVTPSGGSYNFATVTGTPPIGWTNTPVSTSNNSIYVSTAQAYSSTPNGTWNGNASSWSAPVQFTGAGGAAGARGAIPMAYVISNLDPTTAPGNSTSALTYAFTASRTSLIAPIGTGLNPPVTGDTADFTWASNTAINAVYTYNGTSWLPAAGQVINGNVFITGSVNASALNANDVYALTMRGGAVNVGTYAGTGYWFQANTGNAYIGGNITIGNNAIIGNSTKIGNNLVIGNSATIGNSLFIGNNASIGGNLNVSGLITTGNLIANTVATTTIVPAAVSSGTGVVSLVTQNVVNPAQFTLYPTTGTLVNITTTIANQPNYLFGELDMVFIANTIPSTSLIELNASIYRSDGANTILVGSRFELFELDPTNPINPRYKPTWVGFADTPVAIGTYTYGLSVGWNLVSGSLPSGITIRVFDRNILLQTLKR